ncbi:MAG: ABC transporter substrate-binding protein [Actinomycetales bacterium]
MQRRLGGWVLALAVLVGMVAGCSNQDAARNDDVVTIRWLIGFGTGLEAGQLEVEQGLVDQFNATHDDVQIEIVVRELFAGSPEWDEVKASDEAPDIIGPIGQSAALDAKDDWLVLTREELGDVEFEPATLESVAVDGGYAGVPIGVYPSMMIVNRKAFAEQGLALPPDRFGDPYQGQTWDWDAVSGLARQLTLDADGNHPGDPGFVPARTSQFGFASQYVITPVFGQSFGQGRAEVANGRMEPPPGVIDGWLWLRERIYVDETAPNQSEIGSDLLDEGSPFTSGNVAMAIAYSWALPPVAESPVAPEVNFAVPPSHDGVSQVPYHFDEFKVLSTTQHRAEAVEAMQFLLNQDEGDLFTAWGPVPARVDLQSRYVETMQAEFPGSNFSDEFLDQLLTHLSVPSPENGMSLTGAEDAADQFSADLLGNPDKDPNQIIDDFLVALAAGNE